MRRLLLAIFLATIAIFMFGCIKGSSTYEMTQSTPVIEETQAPDPTLAPTPSPTPEPDGVEGLVLIDNAEVIFTFLEVDEHVTVTGEKDAYFIVDINGTCAMIDKRLVRVTSGSAYEVWTGYAKKNAALFDNYFLEGEAADKLAINTVVTVTGDLGYCYRVKVGEVFGYIKAADVSSNKVSESKSSSGGGSGGGSDGGDIVLPGFHGNDAIQHSHLAQFFRPEGERMNFPVEGVIQADHVEAYLGFLNQGDSVKVINDYIGDSRGFYNVIFSHQPAFIRTQLVRLPTSKEYVAWDGFAERNTPYYDNYHMSGDPVGKLNTNTVVTVLCELDHCYFVSLDGAVWFVPKDQISTTKISNDGNSGSGGGGGGDWTDPVL